jgi:hypothetical protein
MLDVVRSPDSRAKSRQENNMLRRRREPQTLAPSQGSALDHFHEWLLSLPWVAERPYSLDTPGVRCFGVDCAPLGRRQLWLITGLQRHAEVDGVGVAVILPTDVAHELEDAGRGRIVAPMPAGHTLVTVYGETLAGREELEAIALTAYDCAMS